MANEHSLSRQPAPHEAHRPLSERLGELLDDEHLDGPLTLNRVFDRTEGRGIFLVLILLSIPFLTPISLPGVSNVFGVIMMILGIRLALGLPPHLPPKIGARPLPDRFQKLIRGSTKVLHWLERWVRPRRTAWLGWRAARFANGILLTLVALLLALPIPPVIPLSNTLPGYAILLLSLSMMEEDGILIWVAYGVCAGTVGYFLFWSGAIVHVSLRYYEPVLEWFTRWL